MDESIIFTEKTLKKLIRDLENNEVSIKKLCKFMVNFQDSHSELCFDTWMNFYRVPNNKCIDLHKLLLVALEVTRKCDKNLKDPKNYIRLFGDNLIFIVDFYSYRIEKEEELDFIYKLINLWRFSAIYDTVFIISLKERVKGIIRTRRITKSDIKEFYQAREKVEEIRIDKLKHMMLISRVNDELIEENYLFVQRLENLVDNNDERLKKKKAIRTFLVDKLERFKTMLVKDIALNQELVKEIFTRKKEEEKYLTK